MDSTASAPEDALSAAADAALVTRDSVRTEEMLSSSKTLEMASPLVYHSGALLHSLPQSKAVRPAPEHPRPDGIVIEEVLVELSPAPLHRNGLLTHQKPPVDVLTGGHRPDLRGRGQRRIDKAELSGRAHLGEASSTTDAEERPH